MIAKPRAKVLIIDDSEADRESYRRMLRKNDTFEFEILEAASGAEGLAAYRAHLPDCVLLDFNLPDIDGIEFLTTVQESTPDYAIPAVVMLTGQGSSSVAVESIRRGATDYLVKSNIDPAALNTALARSLGAAGAWKQPAPARFNVLIVDDSESDRELYKRLLRESSYNRFEFTEVETGQEALESFRRMAPDCILLDYNLPDFDGLEVLALLGQGEARAGHTMPVVVMLTGQGSEAVAVEAMKRGAQDYLIKGELTRDVLSRSVATAVEKHTLNRRLGDKEREFEQFCYTVAHDLQAPLRRTAQFCSLLREEAGPALGEDALLYAASIEQNVTGLQTMIRELLAYFSVDRAEPDPGTVDLNQLMETLRERLAPRLAERRAQLVIEPLPVLEHAFATPLLHLFQNLVENGIKFNDRPEPRIEIRCYGTLRQWQILVRDDGIGIERKYAREIFQPFHRLEHARRYEGTGLGLAICMKVARMHQGWIWVDSTPGEGSTFRVLLPKGGAT